MSREHEPPELKNGGSKARKPVSGADLVVAKIATLVVAIAAPALALGPRLWDWVAGNPLTWHSNSSRGPRFDEADPVANVSVHYSGDLIWQRTDASAQHWLVALIPDVVTAGICVAVGVLAFRLLQRIHKRQPFRGAAVTHVRAIGILVLSYGMFVPLITITTGAILTFPAQSEASYGFHIDATFFIAAAAGIVILVLSEVWRHGQRMDDDLTGLV